MNETMTLTMHRAEPKAIIASVVKCFRDGVCIVDRRSNGFIMYGVNPDSKVSVYHWSDDARVQRLRNKTCLMQSKSGR